MSAADALRAAVEKYKSPDPTTLAKLPKPTKRENPKGKCNVCGGWHGLPAVHLDYMGHADVTLALLDVDPEWTWEPVALTATGPAITAVKERLVMWGYLVVLGVRRLCVGTCEAGKPDPEKELIGDLLRNGAMRFGIGTNLWSKSEASELAGHEDALSAKPVARKATPAPPPGVSAPPPGINVTTGEITRGDITEAQLKKLHASFSDRGIKGKEERIEIASRVVGRLIASSLELSKAEGGRVIDHLEQEFTP